MACNKNKSNIANSLLVIGAAGYIVGIFHPRFIQFNNNLFRGGVTVGTVGVIAGVGMYAFDREVCPWGAY